MNASAGAPHARCPACGTVFDRSMAYPRSGREPPPIAFTSIALCPNCGLGMALPAPSQDTLDAYYASGTYWGDTVGDSRLQSLLDVGAGHGWTQYWLDALKPGALASFEFIEPDEARSRQILARRTPSVAKRIESLAQAHAGYDLIFLNHVLEHVADPLGCVVQVAGLLGADGIAYFELPHADQRFKRDVFPHTWFFTPAALLKLGERAGVKEVLREEFGRLPTSGAGDLLGRAAFRMSASLGLADLARTFDERLWRYDRPGKGIWLRWIVARSGDDAFNRPSRAE
jgi:SAM-dependent methyltransferase